MTTNNSGTIGLIGAGFCYHQSGVHSAICKPTKTLNTDTSSGAGHKKAQVYTLHHPNSKNWRQSDYRENDW